MKNYLILYLILNSMNIIFSKEILLKVIDQDIIEPLEGVKVYSTKNNDEINYTDKAGKLKITVSDNTDFLILTCELIGYQTKKIRIDQFDKEIEIYISIENILEGNELVIEEKKNTKNEELGVSKVIDKNQLKSTSMSSMVQDVMSTIKTLPGVSFGGGRGMGGNNLSIRGGDTDGLTILLDGFIVRYPYQWNNMYSIFTPNVVDSVKFSAGIFSAKNGFATSALMEVNSITPDEGLKMMTLISLADSEIYIQTPLWKNSGLLLGGRFIYYDLVNLVMRGAANSMGANLNNQYLRDGYFKWFWKPVSNLEWYINGFFGSDGSKMDSSNMSFGNSDGITNTFNMDYYNYDTFWNTGFKILPNDKIFIHFFAGYEYLNKSYNGSSGYDGEQEYSDDFLNYYQNLRLLNPSLPDITGIDSFSINSSSSMNSYKILHSLQTRGDIDITLHEKVLLSAGGGGIFDFNKSGSNGSMWQFMWNDGSPVYKKVDYSSEDEDKQILTTFLYLSFNINIIPEKLKIEAGCRIEHNLLFGEGYHINTYPVPGPRFNLTYTPVKNLNFLESLSFSAGLGLFSKAPDISNISKEMELNDFDITTPITMTAVIGTEIKFPVGLSFKIEGYYKFLFNRFYFTTDNSKGEMDYEIHTDGIGHACGFDLTLEKSFSRWLDGSITYSFIFAKLLNPSGSDSDNETMNGEPAGTWFYPSYHKFHNFNIILNIRPTPWFTITPKFVLSSGAPKNETTTETTQSYGILDDGQVAEVYSTGTKSKYNDSLRDNLNFQFDLKLSFGSFIPRSRFKWECFVAVENLFVFLYNPSGDNDGGVNMFTGKSQSSSSANYSTQIPIPNFGFKIEF